MTYNPSAGGGGISGLTTNRLPIATSATTIGDSYLKQELFGSPSTLNGLVFAATTAAGAAIYPDQNLVGSLGRNGRSWNDIVVNRVTTSGTDLRLQPDFGSRIQFRDASGNDRWNSDQHLRTNTANTVDIGETGFEFRTGRFGTSVIAPLLSNTGSTIILRGVTYTLPSADGSSGHYLGTNGSGTLSWSTPTFTPGTSYTFPAITAPGTPASGWVVYTDTADGRLKAKNSAGTVKTLA